MCPLQTAEEMQEEPTGEDMHEEQKRLVAWEALRPSLPEDQAGVIHAISPIWMKLCQIEGATKQL